MGAYLSRPQTEKESASGSNEFISYGSSSMQGWRRFQEDAHNCLLDFDPKRTASLFAVYDGHGGSEVAKYCSLHLPEHVLTCPRFSAEEVINPARILKRVFIDFDTTLVEPKARAELRHIANPDAVEAQDGNSSTDEDGGGEGGCCSDQAGFVPESVEELSALHEEAGRPLEAVLRKQCGDDIPEFIQTLLSSLRPKAGEASGSGACCSTSSDSKDDQEDGTREGQAATSQEVEASGDSNRPEGPISKKAKMEEVEKEEKDEHSDKKEADAPSNLPTEKNSAVDDSDIPVIVGTQDCDEEEEEDDEEDDDDDDEDFEIDGEEEEDDDNYFDDEDDDSEDYEDEGGKMPAGFLPRPVGFCEPGVDSGTTACLALVLPEEAEDDDGGRGKRNVYLYVANAGDSRAVLCRAGAAVDLSEDHKPEDDRERERIQAAGGTVTSDGRVNDGLNLSRAIGDHVYKRRKDLKMSEQMISALPDVTRTQLIPGADEFLVIACDGIWNSMTSQAVVDFVYDRLHPDETAVDDHRQQTTDKPVDEIAEKVLETVDRSSPAFLEKICEELFEACLAPNTIGDGTGCDNMTCIILRFDDLNGLAKCAVTKTTTESEEDEDLEEPTAHKTPTSPALVPVPTTNGTHHSEADDDDDEEQEEISKTSSPSPHSPLVKKARTEEFTSATLGANGDAP